MKPITLADQIAEMKRELAMRKRVYPGLILRRKLNQNTADRQIAILEEVINTLEGLRPDLAMNELMRRDGSDS